jgi:glycosyltransferase involved in cell wall biosynthesis
VDAVLAPVNGASIGHQLAIGAGIDTRELRALPLSPRPPVRCLVLGRAVEQGGFAVPLRALAATRARGVDVRFLIVDSVRLSSPKARRLTESLVADLALPRSVELLDTDTPLSLSDILHRVHAVIDVGSDTEVDHVVLQAMACARPVLSARPSLTPLLADESLPLVFATGDAGSLAACMSAIADARHDELTELGVRLRCRVERQHSLPRWGVSIAAVVETLRAR